MVQMNFVILADKVVCILSLPLWFLGLEKDNYLCNPYCCTCFSWGQAKSDSHYNVVEDW